MKRRTELCTNCGKAASIVRGDFDLTPFGVPVLLKGWELIECAECGHADPIIPDMDTVMMLAACRLISKSSLLSGREVRFLRKYVGKSAREFSALLHVDHTHLSKIENDNVDGAQLDKYLRLLVINLADLKIALKAFLDVLPTIEDTRQPHCKMVLININPADLRQYQQLYHAHA